MITSQRLFENPLIKKPQDNISCGAGEVVGTENYFNASNNKYLLWAVHYEDATFYQSGFLFHN